MKKKLKYLWITTTVSFLLSIQYIERYADERNRMLFLWKRWDGLAIVFSAFLVGLLFYFAYILACKLKIRHSAKFVESAFIAILGIAIIKDIENWLFKSANYSQWLDLSLKSFIYFLYGALLCTLCIHFFSKTQKIKSVFISLCLILSPIIPVFLITSFTYKTWTPNKGTLSYFRQLKAEDTNKPSTFIFFFDGWSYNRSYHNRQLLPFFKNLGQFKESSTSFHQAYSPYTTSFRTIPSFFFQNPYVFGIKNNQLFFEEEEGKKKLVDEMESIFAKPQREGYFTALLGDYQPYADYLGKDVDFIKSEPRYKMLGENFLAVTSYHLLNSFVLYSFHFFPRTAELVQEACYNQFKLQQASRIHGQALYIIKNIDAPTFAFFHYPFPHQPYIYNQDGPKDVFQIYGHTEDNYMGNLYYLDKLIGEIILTLKQSGKYETSLIVITSDHSWRSDPDAREDDTLPDEHRHVPLFVKFPNQKEEYETDVELNLARLFEYIEKQALSFSSSSLPNRASANVVMQQPLP